MSARGPHSAGFDPRTRCFKHQGVLALVFAVLLAGFVVQSAAASEAAVVVHHGDGGTTYALVVFPEEEISSFELLTRSTISLTTVAFGGLGEAVCTLDGEGCGLSDCRVRLCQTGDPDSPFWQFFRQDDAGDWISQPLGASASKVRDGDVDGWSWTPHEAGLGAESVGSVMAQIGVDPNAIAAVPAGASQAFTASFDANGNRIEASSSGGVSTLATAGGIGALLLLAVTGIAVLQIRQRRALAKSS